ncbi:LysR family transcriptional regulator [Weissella paramesenteroides]|uniref:LysR family transcriptional regulator n=1 Tax=Weissella paramesenteroides TaxID=1249 RepID=UPI003F747F28
MNQYLETFIIVYETRSFSLAAKTLFVTQPTISIQIQRLEKMIGHPLFIRNQHRTIEPTAEGNVLYEKALKIRSIWQETQDQLDHLTTPNRKLIRIGFSQTVSQMLAANFLKLAQKKLPTIDWHVTVGNSNYIAKQLEQKNLDIGMVEKPLLIDPEKMYRKKIADDQLVRIGKHTGTWLVREPGSGIAHYTQQFFQEYDIMPEKTIQINRNELIISLVQQDIGETIMSQSVIPNNFPNTIINDHFKRTLYSLTANDLEKSLADKINTLLKQSVPLE